jgi:hypothetical protein
LDAEACLEGKLLFVPQLFVWGGVFVGTRFAMKRFCLAVLACLMWCVPALAQTPKADDFPLKVHVVSSAVRFYIPRPGYLIPQREFYQVLEVTVDGKPMELVGMDMDGVLQLGDYPGMTMPPDRPAKDAMPYIVYTTYGLEMPDGSVRQYSVTRLGPQVTASQQ